MKKLASILGIGVISTAVAFAPAFAQQTKPMDQASSATVQTVPDAKTPVANQAGKAEKNLPSKPGNDIQAGQPSSAKPGSDVKETAPSPLGKATRDATKDKAVPPKTGSEVKTEAVPVEPAADVKTGSAPAKTDTGAKEHKSPNVKQDANLKKDTPEKCGTHSDAVATPKHHVKKSVGKPASMTHAKTHASNPDTRKTTEKSAATVPAAEK